MRKLLDKARELIERSEVSRYRIAADTGIDQASLSLFVNGKRGMSTERIEIILNYLGYDIEVVKRETTKEG